MNDLRLLAFLAKNPLYSADEARRELERRAAELRSRPVELPTARVRRGQIYRPEYRAAS